MYSSYPYKLRDVRPSPGDYPRELREDGECTGIRGRREDEGELHREEEDEQGVSPL